VFTSLKYQKAEPKFVEIPIALSYNKPNCNVRRLQSNKTISRQFPSASLRLGY